MLCSEAADQARRSSGQGPGLQVMAGWLLVALLGVGGVVTAGGREGETEAGGWSIRATLMKEEGIFGGSGVSGPPKCRLALRAPHSVSAFSPSLKILSGV